MQSEKQEKLQKVENDAESERLRELRRRDMIEKEKMERFAQLEKWKVRIMYELHLSFVDQYQLKLDKNRILF